MVCVPGDPFFADVVLLCHCDGTNGSSSFPDNSNSAHSVSASAGFTVSTAHPKFGTGAANIATASAFGTIAAGLTDFQFGAGQFTVEGWVYPTTSLATGIAILAGDFQGSTNLGWDFGWNAGSLSFFYSTTGTNNISVGAASTPSLNTWHFIAADRDATNTLRVYIDGTVLASASAAVTFFNSTRSMTLGNDQNTSRGFPGQIDDIRITKGVARYGGTCVPPTAPFPNGTTSVGCGGFFHGSFSELRFPSAGLMASLAIGNAIARNRPSTRRRLLSNLLRG